MSDFAKIFNSDKYGQILVKVDSNDEGNPEVKFFAQPPNLGVCGIALGFNDTESGWELADKAFVNTNLDLAETMVKRMFDAAEGLTNG